MFIATQINWCGRLRHSASLFPTTKNVMGPDGLAAFWTRAGTDQVVFEHFVPVLERSWLFLGEVRVSHSTSANEARLRKMTGGWRRCERNHMTIATKKVLVRKAAAAPIPTRSLPIRDSASSSGKPLREEGLTPPG